MTRPCGCCEGAEPVTPAPAYNPPGLSAIQYRLGTHATFFAAMSARLSSIAIRPDTPAGKGAPLYPLAALTTRELADPALAFLDAWATIGDVLSFYQERIANEGYLPTALERRSILELARLVGYNLRPGVAASLPLAFTVAAGFSGIIPAGTRAQSIPKPGGSPQFFETSEDFEARDSWNALKARRTRPQMITRPGPAWDAPRPTDADRVDTLYFDGITTQLAPADGLLFVFGAGRGEQLLRKLERVDPQPDDARTRAMLVQKLEGKSLPFLVSQAAALFVGSALAAEVAGILDTLEANRQTTEGSVAGMVAYAQAQIREKRAIAAGRGFTRLDGWIEHVLEALDRGIVQSAGKEGKTGKLVLAASGPSLSPLANLVAATARLAAARSAQPASPARLGRSARASFGAGSDVAPKLLAALKPAAAATLYQAWGKVAKAGGRLELHALRARATLFAGTYPGQAIVSHPGDDATKLMAAAIGAGALVTTFLPPSISTAWRTLVRSSGGDTRMPEELPLDAVYDRVKPGSWVVVDRPLIKKEGAILDDRVLSYHRVLKTRTAGMDTGTGFAAKVTLLTLAPRWLDDVSANTDESAVLLHSTDLLRDTLVHLQSEPLALAEEPLDLDVLGDTVALAEIYDGIEPGRWVIVSGERTDVPNVSGVTGSELVMVAGVAQGSRTPLCAAFPSGIVPFETVFYTTGPNASGDRLVVGRLAAALVSSDSEGERIRPGVLDDPKIGNQRFCVQVELAPGFYADAYVPSVAEKRGEFSDFAGMLINPKTAFPLPNGGIDVETFNETGLFAWRVSSDRLQTTLTLANSLAYSYDALSVTIHGNVAQATHGQSVGEVLGDGDASRAFPSFALRQSPLTHVSAPTPSGEASTLVVRVNDVVWHEVQSLAGLGPRDRRFVTRVDDAQKTSIIFGNGLHGARVPSGTANVKAVYRYGIGQAGNVEAGQVSQLATQPLGVQGVASPLPASGGADRDTEEQARRNAPMAVMALDRLVSVRDYADFARTFAGIDKARATRLSDGRRQVVVLTIAGVHDGLIDPASDLFRNLVTSLESAGDPHQPVVVVVRKLKLLVIEAGIAIAADYLWESVEARLRAVMLARFGFDARDLGESAVLSEAVTVMQGVEGVSYVDIRVFDAVSEDVSAEDLTALASTLSLNQVVEAHGARRGTQAGAPPLAAELAVLSPDVPATLTLMRIEP
jgi:hypothetical protein